MSNLLDKASIILTPTAYNNGEALCVKPSDGSGDFDFSRNSAATRVNAQGLVENVQILSSNLVQNGDFSEEGVEEVSNGSFSQEGSEEITNGDFSVSGTPNTSSWALGWYSNTNNVEIANGKLTLSNSAIESASRAYATNGVNSNNILTTNKFYKLQYDIVENNGATDLKYYSANGSFISVPSVDVGSYTLYIQNTSNSLFLFQLVTSNSSISIDNCSIREVGQDWSLGTGWSIGTDKAVANTTGDFVNLYQNSVFVVGKTYKTTFTIVDYTQGSVRLTQGGIDVSGFQNAVGTYTAYFTATQTSLYMQGYQSFIGSITNISVKEVGQNWDLNGEVTIGDNLAHFESNTNTYSYIRQDISSLTSKTYKIQLEVKNYVSGAVQVAFSGATPIAQNLNVSTDGIYTAYLTPNANGDVFEVSREFNGGNFNFDITNISVIEITTDTSLPRINYEGFSYQDALGSEEIVNGDFSNGTNNWTPNANATLTIDNNKLKVTISGASGYPSQFITTEIGKTYKVTSDAFIGTSSRLALYNDADGQFRNLYADGSFDFNITAISTSTQLRLYVFDDGAYGLWDNVSVKEYLGQEVVPDSGCGSWLFEPQTTQLVPYSEDFSQYSVGGSLTINGGFLAPDGTNNAYKITNSGSSTVYLSGIPNLSSTSTRSIYARSVSGTGTATLMSYFGNTNNVFTLTEQWQRFEVNVTTTITGESNFYAADFRGSGTLTEYLVWGANATNDQDYATSYIPSNGSTVTRNQDLCTNGGSLASINSTEGTLYAEIAALSDDGTTRRLAISDGSNANRVLIGYNTLTNSIQFVIQSGGSTSVNQTFTLTDATQFSKVAFKYKENDCSFWIDGVKVGIDTTALMPIGLNQAIFAQGDIARPFFGKTKAVAVWKEALSDAELTELTTI